MHVENTMRTEKDKYLLMQNRHLLRRCHADVLVHPEPREAGGGLRHLQGRRRGRRRHRGRLLRPGRRHPPQPAHSADERHHRQDPGQEAPVLEVCPHVYLAGVLRGGQRAAAAVQPSGGSAVGGQGRLRARRREAKEEEGAADGEFGAALTLGNKRTVRLLVL